MGSCTLAEVAIVQQKSIVYQLINGFNLSNYNPLTYYRNYNNFVSDNLDSWCCALTFDPVEGKN